MYTLYGRSVAFGINDEDVPPIIGLLKGRKLTPEFAASFPLPVPDETSSTGFKDGASNFTEQMESFKDSWYDCDNDERNGASRRTCKWATAAKYPGRNILYFNTNFNFTLQNIHDEFLNNLSGLTGCMVKMVIGRGCCDKYDITNADVTEAKNRLRDDFAFVGKDFATAHTVQS